MNTIFSFEHAGSPAIGRGAASVPSCKGFAISFAAHIAICGVLSIIGTAIMPPLPVVSKQYQVARVYTPLPKPAIPRTHVIRKSKPSAVRSLKSFSALHGLSSVPTLQSRPVRQVAIEQIPQVSVGRTQEPMVLPVTAKLTLPKTTPSIDFGDATESTTRHGQPKGTDNAGVVVESFDYALDPNSNIRRPGAKAVGITEAPIDALDSEPGRPHRVSGATERRSPELSAVQILHMPAASYTDDARAAGIEGTVVVRVLFRATGTVEILSVLKKLGHGLDEIACATVQHIDFKPAQKGTTAIDHETTIGIVFRLAI